jgi:hypothetical protein
MPIWKPVSEYQPSKIKKLVFLCNQLIALLSEVAEDYTFSMSILVYFRKISPHANAGMKKYECGRTQPLFWS